ncbi:MAG: peptidoglycan -binding protein, partial [Pseudomonadota bacterium]
SLDARLTDAMRQIVALQSTVADLEADNAALRTSGAEAATIREQLTAALAAKLEAERAQAEIRSQNEQREILLATAQQQLSEIEAKSAEDQRRLALLNQQVTQLRGQLSSLQVILQDSNSREDAAKVQIEALGTELNAALARVASEERRRAALEEAEAERLREEAERLREESTQLAAYRSEFFGRMREILAGQQGVRIVGDRFVFSSEVLFDTGRADLSSEGRVQISNIAQILRSISADLPEGIDWIIRVDGHTDNVPLAGTGAFRDNWELSQARALSVVRFMSGSLGISPTRLSANGFGEYQPINPADTPAARAQNRRIELKLTER